MLSNPAAKIVITRKEDELTRFMRGEAPLGERALIFDTQSNSNFIELTHTLGQGKDPLISLTFIDPEGMFEDTLKAPSLPEPETKTFRKMRDELQGTDLTPSLPGLGAAAGGTGTLVNEDTLIALGNLIDFLQDNQESKTFYITYGISEDTLTWAGPYRVEHLLTSLSYTGDGVRTITISLQPMNSAYHHLVYERQGGIHFKDSLIFEGTSRPFEFVSESIDSGLFENFFYGDKIVLPADESGGGPRATDFDYHTVMEDVIKSYYSKACDIEKSRVLVVLPNINYTLLKAVEREMKNFAAVMTVDREYKARQTYYDSDSERFYNRSFGLNGPIETILRYFNIQIKRFPVSQQKQEESEQDSLKRLKEEAQVKKDQEFIRKMNTSEAFKDKFESWEESDEETLRLKRKLPMAIAGKLLVKAIREDLNSIRRYISATTEDSPDTIAANERMHKLARQEAEQRVGMANYASYLYDVAGTKDRPGNKPDFILRDINDGFRKAGNPHVEVVAIEETNLRILQLWKDFGVIPKDYDIANEKGVKIVGDMNSIRLFLYGGLVAEYYTNIIGEKHPKSFAAHLGSAEKFYTEGYAKSAGTSAKTRPIHLMGFEKLFTEDYMNKIWDIVAPADEALYGMTAEVQQHPDEFSIEPEEFDSIVKAKIPIFRLNTKNPNILSLDMNVNKAYTAFARYEATHQSLRSMYKTLGAGVEADDIEQIYKIYPDIEKNAADWFKHSHTLHDFHKKIEAHLTGYAHNWHNLVDIGPMHYAKMFAYLWMLSYAKGSKAEQPRFLLPSNYSEDNFRMKLFDELRRVCFTVDINTLPMFKLSDHYSTLLSPCYLIAKQPIMHGKTPTARTRSVASLFSGYYGIVAFTHIINAREAYSSFKLVQQINQGHVAASHIFRDEIDERWEYEPIDWTESDEAIRRLKETQSQLNATRTSMEDFEAESDLRRARHQEWLLWHKGGRKGKEPPRG